MERKSQSYFDAVAGSAIYGHAVLWCASDDRLVTEPRLPRASQTGGAVAAYDGDRGDLSHTTPASGASDASSLPGRAPGGAQHTGAPRLEYGHHVYAAPWWVDLPGRREGLVQSLCPVVGSVEHHGRGLWSRGVRPSAGSRSTGHFPHRSRSAVSQERLHWPFGSSRDPNEHGWAGTGTRQRLYRTAVADRSI